LGTRKPKGIVYNNIMRHRTDISLIMPLGVSDKCYSRNLSLISTFLWYVCVWISWYASLFWLCTS